jgi:hypothetical protein
MLLASQVGRGQNSWRSKALGSQYAEVLESLPELRS